MTTLDVVPVNGGRPVSSRYITQPSAYRSTRGSSKSPLICSGAMNRHEPGHPRFVEHVPARDAADVGDQPEVHEDRQAAGRDEDVGRLQIAMDDAFAMDEGEGLAETDHQAHRLCEVAPGGFEAPRLGDHGLLVLHVSPAEVIGLHADRGGLAAPVRGGGAERAFEEAPVDALEGEAIEQVHGVPGKPALGAVTEDAHDARDA